MKAVFLDHSTIDESIDFGRLNEVVSELKCYPVTAVSQIVERALGAEVIITNKVKIDAARMARLPNLKLICLTATGTDNIDLKTAKSHGVAVTNVSGYSTNSVAQHVFAYLLNVVNNVSFYKQQNVTNPWYKSKAFCQVDAPITELAGKNLGILGYGNLGYAVAKIARAFGMNVLISERPEAGEIRDGRVAFEEVLADSDIFSLHCPLTKETQGLFDTKIFNRMKKGSILINTARGAMVDSDALVVSLRSGQLAHAIIDVLEKEPPGAGHPLLKADVPNLTLTHHIAWGSIQSQQRLMDCVAENINTFIAGEKLNRVD